MRKLRFSESIHEAQMQIMRKDNKVITMGLGVNHPMGIFGTTKDLYKIFSEQLLLLFYVFSLLFGKATILQSIYRCCNRPNSCLHTPKR